MKSFKNKLFIFIALSGITTNILPHHDGWGGGGAFLSGAMLGTTLGVAASRGRRSDRDPAYYEYRDKQSQRIAIKKEIRQYQNELRKINKDKNLDSKTRETQRQEILESIKELREDLKNL